MYIKASYTIENSVIIPFFTLIICSLIILSCYMHDRIIVKNAIESTAVELEQLKDMEISYNKENLISKTDAYLKSKTIFMKNIKVNIEEDKSGIKVSCSSDFLIKMMTVSIDNKQIAGEVSLTRAKKVIRITNALMNATKAAGINSSD